MAYKKDAEGHFADACRKSAKAFSELLNDGWLKHAKTGGVDMSNIYGEQHRLKVFTAYYLKRLSEQKDDNVFFDADTFGTVISAKQILPEVDPNIGEKDMPSISLNDD